ncbi:MULTISPECIES: PocR ligand-binding domain-containing protein [unclassified Luteococcus]|uniref:PocR ligand-binding domain-containing protein n=1 Tax=unclassified Luteococcus TaxID=2639923 RepID=UPI00313C99B1
MSDQGLAAAVDLERMQALQDSFARRTGLALITVGCTGQPLTEGSQFTNFCAIMRSDPQQRRRCQGCDAHGGLQSVMDGRPSIYRCHTGLVDFSVPIMREDTYLGAVLCGQVRLTEGQLSVPYLTTMNSGWQRDQDILRAYQRVPLTDLRTVHAQASELAALTGELIDRRERDRVAQSASLRVAVVTPEPTDGRLSCLPAMAMEQAVEREDLVRQMRVLDSALETLFRDGVTRLAPSMLQPLEDAILRAASRRTTADRVTLRQTIVRHRAHTHADLDRWQCQQYLEGLLFGHYDAMERLRRDPRTMTDLLNLLERQVQRPPSLNRAAKYLNVTPSHLSKTFKAHTGQTFISHVSGRRIARAQLMLDHTDLPIHRIAAELGFQPVNYFSRTFKQHTGQTPSEYRARERQEDGA